MKVLIFIPQDELDQALGKSSTDEKDTSSQADQVAVSEERIRDLDAPLVTTAEELPAVEQTESKVSVY